MQLNKDERQKILQQKVLGRHERDVIIENERV